MLVNPTQPHKRFLSDNLTKTDSSRSFHTVTLLPCFVILQHLCWSRRPRHAALNSAALSVACWLFSNSVTVLRLAQLKPQGSEDGASARHLIPLAENVGQRKQEPQIFVSPSACANPGVFGLAVFGLVLPVELAWTLAEYDHVCVCWHVSPLCFHP